MNYTIIDFTFLGILFCIFYMARKSFRPYILTLSGLFYCFWKSHYTMLYILVLTAVLYGISLLLQKLKDSQQQTKAKIVLLIGIAVLLSQFIILKESLLPNTIYIIGLSFFSFQMVSYLVDIYQNRTTAERNICYLLLTMVWFPKLNSGPVEKVQNLTSQIKALPNFTLFKDDRLYKSLIYIIYGFFCKLVLADRIALYVNPVFSNIGEVGAPWLILASILYTLQIYFDFAGYSNIAIGVSKLFGIELTQNFKTPYFAENISDFWSRWHISLSNWLKEYIYIPLGGNRKGETRKYINLMLVFLLCGFWHGKGLSFILWGTLHGVYSCLNSALKKHNIKILTSGWTGRLITFVEVSAAWIFFRTDTLKDGLRYIYRILTKWSLEYTLEAQQSLVSTEIWTTWIIIIGVILISIFEYIAYRNHKTPCEYLSSLGEVRKSIIIYFLVIAMVVFGIYGNDVTQFIYMQF